MEEKLAIIADHFGNRSTIYLAAVACVEAADEVKRVHKICTDDNIRYNQVVLQGARTVHTFAAAKLTRVSQGVICGDTVKDAIDSISLEFVK